MTQQRRMQRKAESGDDDPLIQQSEDGGLGDTNVVKRFGQQTPGGEHQHTEDVMPEDQFARCHVRDNVAYKDNSNRQQHCAAASRMMSPIRNDRDTSSARASGHHHQSNPNRRNNKSDHAAGRQPIGSRDEMLDRRHPEDERVNEHCAVR